MDETEKRHFEAIEYAEFVAEMTGNKIRVENEGTNDQKIRFFLSDGRSFSVWFPRDGRVKDMDLEDMAEATRLMYAKPELENDRGGPLCCVCGRNTRSVLDGEAWCDHCKRYQ